MIDRLIERIIELQNPTCAGLDTDFNYLPEEMKRGVSTFEEVSECIAEFNMNIIDKISDIVPAVRCR